MVDADFGSQDRYRLVPYPVFRGAGLPESPRSRVSESFGSWREEEARQTSSACRAACKTKRNNFIGRVKYSESPRSATEGYSSPLLLEAGSERFLIIFTGCSEVYPCLRRRNHSKAPDSISRDSMPGSGMTVSTMLSLPETRLI